MSNSEIVKIDDFYVHWTLKDHFIDHTLTIEQWLNMSSFEFSLLCSLNEDGTLIDVNECRTKKWEEIIKAISAVTKHPYWENDLRHEPRIAYDLIGDGYYFIFKIDNNGSTFIVSEREWSNL